MIDFVELMRALVFENALFGITCELNFSFGSGFRLRIFFNLGVL